MSDKNVRLTGSEMVGPGIVKHPADASPGERGVREDGTVLLTQAAFDALTDEVVRLRAASSQGRERVTPEMVEQAMRDSERDYREHENHYTLMADSLNRQLSAPPAQPSEEGVSVEPIARIMEDAAALIRGLAKLDNAFARDLADRLEYIAANELPALAAAPRRES